MSNGLWYVRARLKTRQLLLLITLAREGNVHRAAVALNMTQSATPKPLRELEVMLDTQLLGCMLHGMRLTRYGDALICCAHTVVSNLDQTQEETLGLRAGHLGHVMVGTITSPGVRLLPSVVAQIMRKYPGLRVSLKIENSNTPFERLAQDKLDSVIGKLFAGCDKLRPCYEPLADESVVAVARPGRPLLSEPPLALADVQTAA